MERMDLTQQFAHRLRDTMINAGFQSSRSTSGVDIHTLAKITGHSVQICRKYLQGRAIPDPAKLCDIAEKLNVSPGWLLFGDSLSHDPLAEHKIIINKNLLHYIFTYTNKLYHTEHAQHDFSDFLLSLTEDVSQINANEEKSRKIIDLAFFSLHHFQHNNTPSPPTGQHTKKTRN